MVMTTTNNHLTVAEAASYLGIKTQTLNNWRSMQKGPNYIKYSSRAVRYSINDLDEFIQCHRVALV